MQSIYHGVQLAQELQSQIDALLPFCQPLGVNIRLGAGSEVTDLTYCADVLVGVSGQTVRCFTFVSQQWVAEMFGENWDSDATSKDIFATGNPLVLVKQICGETVVHGVERYLQLEKEQASE